MGSVGLWFQVDKPELVLLGQLLLDSVDHWIRGCKQMEDELWL